LINIGPHLANNIKDEGNPLESVDDKLQQSKMKPVRIKKTLALISDLKDSCVGLDDIKASIVKAVEDQIVTPLHRLLNVSFEDGIFLIH